MAAGEETIVGRDVELAELDAALARLAEKRTGILGISGDPGIGKTRLLRELRARAVAAEHLVLVGSASEFERDLPFSAFVDALDPFLATIDADRLRKMGVAHHRELAAIFPSLADLTEEEASDAVVERHRAHRAISGLLTGLGATRGLVLLIDDLHWADEATLELLRALVRRPPEGAVLIATGYRPQQAVLEFRNALATGLPSGTTALIELRPLSAEASADLIDPGVPERLRAPLLDAAAGNPFYLEQLSRTPDALIDAPDVAEEVLEGGFLIPAPISASLADELRSQDAEVAKLLRGAAVAGEPFGLRLAAEVAEVDPDAAFDLIDSAIAAGLVRAARTPGQFGFRHPLLRRAVYASAGDGWRIAAHGRAAAALGAAGADPAQRAHHVAIASSPGDLEAIELLREAAGRTVGQAPLSAAEWLGSALAKTPDAESELRRALLADRGRALLAGGQLVEAQRVDGRGRGDGGRRRRSPASDRAGRDRPVGGPDGRGRAAARERCARSWATTPPRRPPSSSCGCCTCGAGTGSTRRPSPTGRRRWPRLSAATTSRCSRWCRLRSQRRLRASTSRPRPRTTRPRWRRWSASRRASSRRILDAFYSLGWAAIHLERYEEALDYFRRGLDIALRANVARHMMTLRSEQAEALIRMGRAADAVAQADEAVEAARLHPSPRYLWWSLWIQSSALVRAGRARGCADRLRRGR